MEIVENIKKTNGFAKAAKIIAIIVFCLTFGMLLATIISDFAIFSTQIFGFFVACIAGAAGFIFGCVLLLISIVFLFGIYIIEERGFWPIAWAKEAFHGVVADLAVTKEQIASLTAVRVAAIIACFVAFVGAIVALALAGAAKKRQPGIKQKLTKSFSVLSIVFSSLGLLTAVGIILILTAA